jgi:hypothetical protein
MKEFILRHKFWMSIPILFLVGMLLSLILAFTFSLDVAGVSIFLGNLFGLYIIIGVPIKIFRMIKARR